jgi:hypothetical protein
MCGAGEKIRAAISEVQLPVRLHWEIFTVHSGLWTILLIRTGKAGRGSFAYGRVEISPTPSRTLGSNSTKSKGEG